MKKILIALLCLLTIAPAIAQQQKSGETTREKHPFAKDRSISKTYPAAGNKLSIDNSFGNIKFNHWNKNEIKVDVKIDVSSTDEGVMQRTFEGIEVTDKQDGNEIKFKTTHSKNGASCKNCKISMHVDYEVYLPANTPLDIENSFGSTEIPDHTGAISIEHKFGNLKAGNVPGLKKIEFEFGKAEIKNAANLDGEFKFSQVEIANLSGKNKIKLEFCDKSLIGLDQKLTALTLSESYGNLNLKPESNLGATYNINTKFGSFIDRTSANIKRTDTPDRYGPDSDRKYEGKSGSGAAQIQLKSDFGKIVLGEPAAGDLEKSSSQSGQAKPNRKVVI